jgi:hypothetical protein
VGRRDISRRTAGVWCIRIVDADGRDVVELLALAGNRVGQVYDVENLGPPKRVICTARMQ